MTVRNLMEELINKCWSGFDKGSDHMGEVYIRVGINNLVLALLYSFVFHPAALG